MEVYFTATFEKTVDFIVKVPDGKFTERRLKNMVKTGEILDVGEVVGENWLDESFKRGTLNELIKEKTEPKMEV